MSVRSGGRKASFDLLASDSSGDEHSLSLPFPLPNGLHDARLPRRRRNSKKRKPPPSAAPSPEEFHADEPSCFAARAELRQRKPNGLLREDPPETAAEEPAVGENGFVVLENRSVVETVRTSVVTESESEEGSSLVTHLELRQRNMSGGGGGGVDSGGSAGDGSSSVTECSTGHWLPEANGTGNRLETVESLDWKRVLAEDPNILGEVSSVERSPLKYFMGEIYGGSSLRSTISVGNDKKRQKVYNTVFHVPVRCERLILAGFFVCLDSFLSLLTIMPARIAMTIWRVLKTRQFQRPNAAELSDFGCFIVLALGVTSLQLTDISLIYHIIRGQGLLKLYVVYNVLEIFDKLCQSFGEDVLQVLFNSAEGLANCSTDNIKFELLRIIFDQTIAVIAFIVHSFVLLAQAITLSTCIIAHNNALLALLISNNFAEIKSNVFKRVSKENLHNLVYYDIVERFHITAFVIFVLAQNILEAEGPWFGSFLTNTFLVYICEVLVDTIKHSFLSKFNEIKPVAYSEFLEDLCKQTLNEKPEERQKDLTFIPLAPACVVIRVLTPIYATLLPHGPLPWRLTWILLWCTLTYIMLAVCKILVGLSLRRLATWYLSQCFKRKQHMD